MRRIEEVVVLIPLPFKCQGCGASEIRKVHLDETSPSWTCKRCGTANLAVFGLELTVGYLLLARSYHELEVERDYSMSIILAAAALESELSRLFIKWSRIDSEMQNQDPRDDEIEDMLRQYRNVADKIDGVSRLLDQRGIDEFVRGDLEFQQIVETGFPSLKIGSLAKDIQKSLFWPRNRILHVGYANFDRESSRKLL
jgi:hypothetical protein